MKITHKLLANGMTEVGITYTLGQLEALASFLGLKAKPGGYSQTSIKTPFEQCEEILREEPWRGQDHSELRCFEELYAMSGRRGDYFTAQLAWLRGPRDGEVYEKIWVFYKTHLSEGGKWYGEQGKYAYGLARVLSSHAWREPLENKWR